MSSEKRDLMSMLPALIDHTLLRPEAGPDDIGRLCREALEYRFASVMVHPCRVEQAVELVSSSAVLVGTVIGFPLGQNILSVKLFEAMHAIEQGASELDMVLNIGSLVHGRHDIIREEMSSLAELCKEYGVTTKVILETALLDDEMKRAACRIAVETGIAFVKTSTGFAGGGATVADVKLMHATVAGKAEVKAAGGIRTLADARALIAAGATRLGTSAGVALMREIAAEG